MDGVGDAGRGLRVGEILGKKKDMKGDSYG